MNKILKLLFNIWSSPFIIRNIQLMVCLICWETCLCYQRMQIQSDVQTMPGIRKSCYVLMCHCMLSLSICMLTSFSAFGTVSWVSQNVSLEGMTRLFKMLSVFVVSVLPSKVNGLISIAAGWVVGLPYGPPPVLSRREECIITQLQTADIDIAHSHLLCGEPVSICLPCG
jgi:hypothetical protein